MPASEAALRALLLRALLLHALLLRAFRAMVTANELRPANPAKLTHE